MNSSESLPSRVDLAAERDFRVGDLNVSPSTCRVADAGGEARVEPRVMAVLIVLHRNAGRTVTRDELIETCWGGRAVSDDAVTRAIMKVRQLARNAEPPHFTVNAVPKVGFRLTETTNVPAQGSTAELPQPSTPEAFPSERAPLATWVAASVGVVLIAAIAFIVGTDHSPQPFAPAARIALFPFEALQKADELDRLSRQTDDAIARQLTARGIATATSSRSASSDSAAANAELVVAGVVDREGDAYKIKTTVSASASDLILWSQTFERKVSEPEGLHEEAANSLAAVLVCALKERKSAVPMPADVLSLFLHSCAAEWWRSGQALEVTRRLVEKAPHLAGAHAHRAFALAGQAEGLDHLSADAARFASEARRSAERALALDANSADAHLSLSVRIGPDPRFTERERQLARALNLDPDHGGALDEYGRLLREVGRIGAAGEVFRRIAPNGNLIQGAMVAAMQGKFSDAYPMIERLEVLSPRWAREVRWVLALWWEDPANALQHIERVAQDAGRADRLPCVRPHLEAIVRKRTVRGLAPACERLDIDWRVRLLARQGDIDGAYRLMAQRFPNSRSPTMFLFYPEMKRFRHDARFMPLVARLGLLSYWREANQWPDFCAEADLPYDCRTWRTSMK
jgi:DNA-binding winged helix-turn-helix (wHTH) protein/TolB-like protein